MSLDSLVVRTAKSGEAEQHDIIASFISTLCTSVEDNILVFSITYH
jgi:hypothetical protein